MLYTNKFLNKTSQAFELLGSIIGLPARIDDVDNLMLPNEVFTAQTIVF